MELRHHNITTITSFEVKSIEKNNHWIISDTAGNIVESSKLIITTGGRAAHQFGSSGDGLHWAKNLDHSITPIYAALVPVETVETWPKEVSGVKVEASVKVVFNNNIISEKFGDLLFTHFGVSGPAIMAQSAKIAPLLADGKVELKIDIFNELKTEDLDKKLATIFSGSGAKTIKNSLIGVAPTSVLSIILQNAKIDGSKKAAEISKADRAKIVDSLKNMTLTVKALRPLKEAQVTSGGVSLGEINSKTLESKIVPNLYFAGEVLDVDGDSGGFNLQWAWSSGYVAGHSASQ
jgi:predicted Rossmann fold flavoprotein